MLRITDDVLFCLELSVVGLAVVFALASRFARYAIAQG
jgi:hypothetical protein